MTRSPDALLRVDDVSKRFGRTQALRNVSFSVGRGQVHALLGSNGSGKSTLVKLLAGVGRADQGGNVSVGDRSVASTALGPADSDRLGLRFVHQQLGLFGALSIADNFGAVAGFERARYRGISRTDVHRRTAAMLHEMGIHADPAEPVDRLRPSAKTLVAIGRAMADHEAARVLVLDEPTESLGEEETGELLSSLRRLAAAGMTVILVSHRLAEVEAVADTVTVLRDGAVVADGPLARFSRADLVESITGQAVEAAVQASTPVARSGRQPVLELDDVSTGPVGSVSLRVHPGEIVGLAGLRGSGRSALLEGIFGARHFTRGQVRLDGHAVRVAGPADAVRLGIALVPEDRSGQGSFADRAITDNLTAPRIRDFARWGTLSRRRENAEATSLVATARIRASSPVATMSTLSGGNQQKVIVARWLATEPRLVLLDEPTQGVDVGARAEIHRSVRSAVERGIGCLLVSSDLDELCSLSDRVLVLDSGRVSAELRAPVQPGEVAAHLHGAAAR